MPIRQVPGTDLSYYLVVFDEAGNERAESDDTYLSEVVAQQAAAARDPITDVFFTSHGWKGDVPAAIEQYDRWIGAMAAAQPDEKRARVGRPEFRPLIVGLHWPSLPWGDESLPGQQRGVLSAANDAEQELNAYAARIATTGRARAAIRVILEAARSDPGTRLSQRTLDAYAALFQESGLGIGNAGAAPGSDQPAFDPAAIIRELTASELAPRTDRSQVLGLGEDVRDVILGPLRQLSFWKMKDRARAFGEGGGHNLLIKLQAAAPNARIHLMGHSFGCIVVSATVSGPPGKRPLPRPVDSLFLVQGALSLWSFAPDIPYSPKTPGYFSRILEDRLVRGPILTTRSEYDTAVGRYYPLGAATRRQLVLAGTKYPEYGGIGTFGIQGVTSAQDLKMQPVGYAYTFREGTVYNVDASQFIKIGDGASGAHSDIAHPEVAHVFWAAILPNQGQFLGPATGIGVPKPERRDLDAARDWGATSRGPPHGPADGLLGATTQSQNAMAPTFATTDQRWLNAELEGHPPDEGLTVGKWYNLAFDISVEQRSSAIPSAPFSTTGLFAANEQSIALTVRLDSKDFDIGKSSLMLHLGQQGPSIDKATFGICPLHDGPSTLTATLYKDNNFIQQMELRFVVGAHAAVPIEMLSRGRSVAAAGILRPRDACIVISRSAGGYDCLLSASVAARARLPLEPAYLASAIDAARDALMQVVTYKDSKGDFVFQNGIDISEEASADALKIMARAGSRLFQKLFFGPAAAEDSRKVGDFLRRIASDRAVQLKLQIVAETVPVPWGLLYLGDADSAATLDWDNFIGMRHIVEQIPLQNTAATVDSAIRSNEPSLAISVNFNRGIDAQMGADFVERQSAFWTAARQSRKKIRITERTKGTELTKALANAGTDDQIAYFYCHASAAALDAPGGPDESALELTDASLTLADLNIEAPTSTSLPGNPLVFINACESAEMSPAFYDGFVPYFMAKGARGVVGTECKMPALFAAEWARVFFDRFLDGEALGALFLSMRQTFLKDHRNPLGLLYAVYCDGDTKIEPALLA